MSMALNRNRFTLAFTKTAPHPRLHVSTAVSTAPGESHRHA